jgi:hypothetical protein
MIPSMSRPANPYDNASCESFIKTLKREEIYANRYDDLEHLRMNIEEFMEQYYNRQRLHSALGYRSPEEFERQSESPSSVAGSRSATMQFFESDENGENEIRVCVFSTFESHVGFSQATSLTTSAVSRNSCCFCSSSRHTHALAQTRPPVGE